MVACSISGPFGPHSTEMLRAGSKGVWDEWMGIQLECQYEEDLTKQPEARVRWYEAAGTYGGVLASRPTSKKRPL